MKKILVCALALYVTLSLAACGTPAGKSSLPAQEGDTVSSSGSAPLQEQDHPENQVQEPAVRIDTEKQSVWYEGFDEERSSLTQYEYDEAGCLVRIVPVEENGGVINCYDYDAAGNLIREYDSDEIFVTEYTYDSQGRRNSTTQKYDGNVLSVETYTYDSQNHKVMAMEEGVFQGDPGSYTATTVFSYDDDGRLVQEKRTTVSQIVGESADQYTSSIEYDYQADGKLAEERAYAGEKLTSTTTYSYDPERLIIKRTEYQPSAEVQIVNFEYDEHGNLTQEVTIQLGADGAQRSRTTHEYTYTEVGQ